MLHTHEDALFSHLPDRTPSNHSTTLTSYLISISAQRTTTTTMSDTSPSARKKPQCRSCGNPMAGHRRVSGRYMCPDDDHDVSDGSTKTITPPPRSSPRPRSHPQEQHTQQTPPPSTRSKQSTNRTPRSKDAKRERTASPAPAPVNKEYHKTQDESFYTDDDLVGSPVPPQQRAPKLRPTSSIRNLAQRLGAPLASIFTAAKSDIEEVQQEAGRHGLYTGTVYKPRKIKEEESQRWVVMGRDPDAVDRLVDYQRKDVARQLGLGSRTTTPVPVSGAGAIPPPINVTCNGPSIWRIFVTLVFASVLGALVLFYMFVYL